MKKSPCIFFILTLFASCSKNPDNSRPLPELAGMVYERSIPSPDSATFRSTSLHFIDSKYMTVYNFDIRYPSDTINKIEPATSKYNFNAHSRLITVEINAPAAPPDLLLLRWFADSISQLQLINDDTVILSPPFIRVH